MAWNVRQLFDHSELTRSQHAVIFALLTVIEVALGYFIIQRVPYTEIDWVAYMQEVTGFLGGEYDYTKLKGDTGPLVYPAGFVYLYSGLYYVTDLGENILRGQYIFLALYVSTVAIVLRIYYKSKQVPWWSLFVMCLLGRRIHSLFMLRLFNDCFAMWFFYIAVLLFIYNRWSWGCLFYSLGVSIKMNIFLFAPALFVLLVQRFGLVNTIVKLFSICASSQVILALPFLLTFPVSYFGRAFEFGRQFKYKWTVNWKFVEEETFLSKPFALGLLAVHVVLLLLFAHRFWCRADGGLLGLLQRNVWSSWRANAHNASAKKKSDRAKAKTDKEQGEFNLPAAHIVDCLFVCNFLGIVCARSLHYQFYSWYYHTLPLLLWTSCDVTPNWFLNHTIRLLSFIAIELCWNVYPATWWSSGLLLAVHVFILLSLFQSRRRNAKTKTV